MNVPPDPDRAARGRWAIDPASPWRTCQDPAGTSTCPLSVDLDGGNVSGYGGIQPEPHPPPQRSDGGSRHRSALDAAVVEEHEALSASASNSSLIRAQARLVPVRLAGGRAGRDAVAALVAR
jgi:hypothetical protein